jgi:WD40 repeat protein
VVGPAQIGPYRIERRLGAGGMGVVYLGRDPGNGDAVAVKVIRPELAEHPNIRARLRREARAARRVPRFCTAAVVGADLDAEPPYIATEYIDAPTLDVAVLERGPLTGAALAELAAGAALALREIHRHGVLHRDLKPSNILLSSLGPRVIDFGIAQLADSRTVLTDSGVAVGTPAFMAPEQVRGERPTAAVDVFAWAGVVVYAATGRPPSGKEPLPRLEEPLRSLVRRAMEEDPGSRPTAAELADRLTAEAGEDLLRTAALPVSDTRPWWDEEEDAEPDASQEPADEVQHEEEATRHTASTIAGGLIGVAFMLALVVFLVYGGIRVAGLWSGGGGFGSELATLKGHEHDVTAVAAGTLNGRPIVVSTSQDKTVRLWDVTSGKALGKPLYGHKCGVGAVAVATVEGRTVAVSGGGRRCSTGFLGLSSKADYSVRMWDLAKRREVGRGVRPNMSDVLSLAVGDVDGRTVVVFTSFPGSRRAVQIWDLTTFGQRGKTRTIDASSISFFEGRPLGVEIGDGHTVTVRNLATGERHGKTIKSTNEAQDPELATLNGRTVVVANVLVAQRAGESRFDRQNTLQIWDPLTGEPVRPPIPLPDSQGAHRVRAVATVSGRTIAATTTYSHGEIYLWDLTTGVRLGVLDGHDDGVNAVAFTTRNGSPVLVSASDDDTVRIWTLAPFPTPSG